ncbi:cation diffusion facilitator family transporter [Streptomyces hazeniae]|uniref:cation diffusion facilitator family transporter n=1 Tax=Streptomyces hazeniae TaxID=3075538 RepID=UPI00374E199D
MGGHDHGHGGHGHDHGVSAETDRRWLTLALALLVAFMLVEAVAAVMAGSLALLSDAAHMLTDAVSIVLALVALRLSSRPPKGGYTYGLKRVEILSAQANGLTLLLLACWLAHEAVHRLFSPPDVEGGVVVWTALAGIVVNVACAWCISRANRSSLNVEGAYQHVLNDLFAFIGTAVAGVIVVTTGFVRADPLATLLVVALMVKAGWGLVRDATRVFLQAAPDHLDPDTIRRRMAQLPGVEGVRNLHVWLITSGEPTLSAHVVVRGDCHAVSRDLRRILAKEFALSHVTLQTEHANGRLPASPAAALEV